MRSIIVLISSIFITIAPNIAWAEANSNPTEQRFDVIRESPADCLQCGTQDSGPSGFYYRAQKPDENSEQYLKNMELETLGSNHGRDPDCSLMNGRCGSNNEGLCVLKVPDSKIKKVICTDKKLRSCYWVYVCVYDCNEEKI